MSQLSRGITAKFTEDEYAAIQERLAGTEGCPAVWVREVVLEKLRAGAMSREVLETRVGVNTIAELLCQAFPEQVSFEAAEQVIKENRKALEGK